MFKEEYIVFMEKELKPSKVEEGVFFINQIKNGVERKEIIELISELHKIKRNSAKLYVTRAMTTARKAGHEFNGKPIKGTARKDSLKMSKQTEEITIVEVLPPEKSNMSEENSVEKQRKLGEIAESIRNYTFQIRDNIINIGKCFIEAKKLVKHGEWDKWIEENTTFTRQTVYKFMQCAKRFADVAPAKHLNDTQMMELLALPVPQMNAFFEAKEEEGTPVKDMTKKVLRSEIKSWNEVYSNIKKNTTSNKSKDVSTNEQDTQQENETVEESKEFKIVELKVRIGDEDELAKILKDALKVAKKISDENRDALQNVIEALSMTVG